MPDPGNPGPAPPRAGLRAERRSSRIKGGGPQNRPVCSQLCRCMALGLRVLLQSQGFYNLSMKTCPNLCFHFMTQPTLIRVVFEYKKKKNLDGGRKLEEVTPLCGYSGLNHPRGGSRCQQYPIRVYQFILSFFSLVPKPFYRRQVVWHLLWEVVEYIHDIGLPRQSTQSQ